MSRKLKEIEEKTSFVTVKHLSAKELKKIVLKMPNIEKQSKNTEKEDKKEYNEKDYCIYSILKGLNRLENRNICFYDTFLIR